MHNQLKLWVEMNYTRIYGCQAMPNDLRWYLIIIFIIVKQLSFQ